MLLLVDRCPNCKQVPPEWLPYNRDVDWIDARFCPLCEQNSTNAAIAGFRYYEAERG